MDSKALYLALSEILKATNKEVINWRIDGTSNLFINGMPILPNKLEIATNHPGLKKFESSLKRFTPEKAFNEKTKNHSIKCKIANIDIEITSYENNSMLDKTMPIMWSRLTIPALSLDDAMYIYRMASDHDKVDLIVNFLSTQIKKSSR